MIRGGGATEYREQMVLSLEKTKEIELFFWFFARLFVPLRPKKELLVSSLCEMVR